MNKIYLTNTLLWLSCSIWAEDIGLEIIEITAERTAQPSYLAPVSASVITKETLLTKGFNNLEQLTRDEPGVFAAANSNAAKLFIRGIGGQGNAGLEQSASVYVDGVYYPRSRSIHHALVDIEQVTILKGPQSTFWGLNATAGVLAVNSQQAQIGQSEGYSRLLTGSDGKLGGTFVYNQPLTDKLAIRAVLDQQEDSGYWTMIDAAGEEIANSGQQASTVRLSTAWQPTSTLQAHLKLDWQEHDRRNPYAWQPGGCDNLYGLGLSTSAQLQQFWLATGSTEENPLKIPASCKETFVDATFDSRSPASPFNRSNFDQQEAVLAIEWQLGQSTLNSRSAFITTDFSFSGNDLSHGVNFHRILSLTDDHQQQSQSLELNTAINEQISWHIGGYWHQGKISYQTTDVDGRNRQQPQLMVTTVHQDEQQYALFNRVDWQIKEDLTIGAGLRWARTEKKFTGESSRIQARRLNTEQAAQFRELLLNDVQANVNLYDEFTRQSQVTLADQQQAFAHFLPSVQLSYILSPEIQTYYRWDKGAKSGGFNFRLNNLQIDDLVYGSEKVTAHEVGIKGRLLRQRVEFAVSIFHSDYDDLQQNSNRGDGGAISAAVIRNASAASSKGIETEWQWLINEQLSVDIAGTWLKAEFDDYQGADCTRLQSVILNTDVGQQFGATQQNGRCSQSLNGADLPFAPKLSSRGGITYTYPISERLILTHRLEWIHSDGFFTSPHADSLRRQSRYDKYNLSIHLSDQSEQWSIRLAVNNLTDKLTSRQLGQDGNAAVSGLIEAPRHWLLQGFYYF